MCPLKAYTTIQDMHQQNLCVTCIHAQLYTCQANQTLHSLGYRLFQATTSINASGLTTSPTSSPASTMDA